MPKMANTDLSKLLKSEEIRKVLRAPNRKVTKAVRKSNPLKNIRAMIKLNPYAAVMKKNAELVAAKNLKAKVSFFFLRYPYFFSVVWLLNYRRFRNVCVINRKLPVKCRDFHDLIY